MTEKPYLRDSTVPPIQLGDTPLPSQPSRLKANRLLRSLLSLTLSSLLHILIFSLLLLAYINITSTNPGHGFTAGQGDVGNPFDVQKIEALGDPLLLEQALAPAENAVANPAPTDLSQSPIDLTIRPIEVNTALASIPNPADSKISLESLVSRQWDKAALSSRSPGTKQALLRSEGGTPESEKAVQRGLEWLASHQKPNGSWSLAPASVCGNAECGTLHVDSPEAATGLALLPFLGAGHLPGEKGPYQKNIDSALEWLQSRVHKSGRIIPDNAPLHFHMYAHAIVTIALCETTALKPDGLWAPAARRSAQYIINAQNRLDGGWRYFPGEAGDTSVFGWQVMALRSAAIAGMKIPKSALTLSRRWLTVAQSSRDGSVYSYQPGRAPTPVMTAEALLCRQLMGDSPKSRGMATGTQLVYDDLVRSASSRNYYYWYYATQLMHNTSGKKWSGWNPVIRERLINEQLIQSDSGHALGSWQPDSPGRDRWGTSGGPIMQTSLALLTLEVYYRFLPIYKASIPKNDPTPEQLDQTK